MIGFYVDTDETLPIKSAIKYGIKIQWDIDQQNPQFYGSYSQCYQQDFAK